MKQLEHCSRTHLRRGVAELPVHGQLGSLQTIHRLIGTCTGVHTPRPFTATPPPLPHPLPALMYGCSMATCAGAGPEERTGVFALCVICRPSDGKFLMTQEYAGGQQHRAKKLGGTAAGRWRWWWCTGGLARCSIRGHSERKSMMTQEFAHGQQHRAQKLGAAGRQRGGCRGTHGVLMLCIISDECHPCDGNELMTQEYAGGVMQSQWGGGLISPGRGGGCVCAVHHPSPVRRQIPDDACRWAAGVGGGG